MQCKVSLPSFKAGSSGCLSSSLKTPALDLWRRNSRGCRGTLVSHRASKCSTYNSGLLRPNPAYLLGHVNSCFDFKATELTVSDCNRQKGLEAGLNHTQFRVSSRTQLYSVRIVEKQSPRLQGNLVRIAFPCDFASKFWHLSSDDGNRCIFTATSCNPPARVYKLWV